MSELANRSIEMADLLGARGRLFIERLAGEPTWESRFALLDRFFLTRLGETAVPAPAVRQTWQRLVETGGRIDIGRLAGEAGCSRKHLIAQFRAQVGLPPKTLARILRFQRSIELLAGVAGPRWAEIAYDCGYYDQAHFNRDFREFTGTTPGDFLTRRLPEGGGLVGD
jgi:AraC-like DNA-binding protein